MGLLISRFTPASFASCSMDTQSYAVIMMIVTSGPTILRIRLAVSKPSISGIFQSMSIIS